MKIIEEFKLKQADLYARKPITIAFLGDSVTQGCFECFENIKGQIDTVFESGEAYAEKVKKIFAKLYPSVPVTVVNAGISGGKTGTALSRIQRDVLIYQPDLAVVCFGLNDTTFGLEGLQSYADKLNDIFTVLKENNIETIFMTPNTMNYEQSPFLTIESLKALSITLAERMNEGVMDKYMETAISIAEKNGVKVCDCYSKWKRMHDCGVNTTELLSNKLNHPDREMQWLFAYELVNCIFH